MQNLSKDWLLQYWDDEEMPKYKLMQYLQEINGQLNRQHLFPAWEDIYENYKALVKIRQNLNALSELNKGDIVGFDIHNAHTIYNPSTAAGTEEVLRLKTRLDFAIPIVKATCITSEKTRVEIDAEVELQYLGVRLLNVQEGILLTMRKNDPIIWSWQYHCSFQEKPNYSYTAVRTKFIGHYTLSLRNSLFDIRRQSLDKIGLSGSTVSTWLAESKCYLPHTSALKPVAVLQLAKELGL